MTDPPRRFSRILVANRGEIAVRIIRACRLMSIDSLAIFSTADRSALHVLEADESYCVGPAPALESYLKIEAILAVAQAAGADAVHPGYGFLSENPQFARAVVEAGLTWIGPPPDVIGLMGDKVAAKELARSHGVPTVPGYAGESQTIERMTEEARQIGFPVMLKAAAGGGGKGMRSVNNAQSLPDALDAAKREARAAFGDDRVFLEKLVGRPRHVEIQVLLDGSGGGVYLGERDCSLQRRHQKVLEEAPSPAMGENMRAAMGEAALALARAAGYVNAGTVEFLVSGDQFYFLEMNTRIQVEHPVTEMVTGIDLVRAQIEVAQGAPLRYRQSDINLRGHAVEARLYAEDPSNDFLPSTGKLTAFCPPIGPDIRNDVGVYDGVDVSRFYDPLLAKLIVRGDSREEAIARLADALDDYVISGPVTNLQFLRWLVRQPAVAHGGADIEFIDREWRPAAAESPPEEALLLAALYLANGGGADSASPESIGPWRLRDAWRQVGLRREFSFSVAGTRYKLQLCSEGSSTWRVVNAGESVRCVESLSSPPGTTAVREGSRVLLARVEPGLNGLMVELDGRKYEVRPDADIESTGSSGSLTSGHESATAPMPGTVVKVVVTEGQSVLEHEPLVIIEAMKMEHVIEAPHAGVVREIHYREGDLLAAGATVVDLERA